MCVCALARGGSGGSALACGGDRRSTRNAPTLSQSPSSRNDDNHNDNDHKNDSFATTEEPCCFVELFSIGAIGGAKNTAIAAKVMAIVEDKLGVSKARCYMSFHDAQRSDFAWNGATF